MSDKGTILMIEDSQSVRYIMEDFLSGLGYSVMQAGDAETGLDLYKRICQGGSRPILMTVDLGLPGMSGIEFITEVRKGDKKTPILMVTTNAQPDRIQAGRDAGANAWVIKPVHPESFTKLIKRFTE